MRQDYPPPGLLSRARPAEAKLAVRTAKQQTMSGRSGASSQMRGPEVRAGPACSHLDQFGEANMHFPCPASGGSAGVVHSRLQEAAPEVGLFHSSCASTLTGTEQALCGCSQSLRHRMLSSQKPLLERLTKLRLAPCHWLSRTPDKHMPSKDSHCSSPAMIQSPAWAILSTPPRTEKAGEGLAGCSPATHVHSSCSTPDCISIA